MRRVWLVTALAACAKVPDEPRFDKAPLVTIGTANSTIQVHGQGYDVGFGPAGMVRMPDTITVGNEPNLIGNNGCPVEDFVGVAVFPALLAAASQTAVSSTILRISDGPVIAKLGVTYDVATDCGGTQQHLTGTTFFTFFPTGRINREDTMVSPTTTGIPSSLACHACGGAIYTEQPQGVFFFTTYYEFAADMFVTAAGTPAPREPAPVLGCALAGNRTIGVAWRNDNPGVGPRIQNNAYIHDWVRNQAGPLAPQVRAAFSDLVLVDRASASCADVLQVAHEVPLRIAGAAVPPGDDGIYQAAGGEVRGTIELELANPGVDGPIAHGFAVSFILGTPDHFSVRRGGETTDKYRLQPDPDDPARTIVWFEDGIAPGETIELEVD